MQASLQHPGMGDVHNPLELSAIGSWFIGKLQRACTTACRRNRFSTTGCMSEPSGSDIPLPAASPKQCQADLLAHLRIRGQGRDRSSLMATDHCVAVSRGSAIMEAVEQQLP